MPDKHLQGFSWVSGIKKRFVMAVRTLRDSWVSLQPRSPLASGLCPQLLPSSGRPANLSREAHPSCLSAQPLPPPIPAHGHPLSGGDRAILPVAQSESRSSGFLEPHGLCHRRASGFCPLPRLSGLDDCTRLLRFPIHPRRRLCSTQQSRELHAARLTASGDCLSKGCQ